MSNQRLVLLGDSILDNALYTRPEPDTTSHLRMRLAPGWSVDCLAVDGSCMHHVPMQLAELDGRASAAVLSIGGNDVLIDYEALEPTAGVATDVLDELLMFADSFGRLYEETARQVAGCADRTLLCTIYEVPLEPPSRARFARVPLTLLNDRIIGAGARLGLDVLDLRSVCSQSSDFVQQIEPSAQGAIKIAAAIADVVDGGRSLSSGRVFAR